MHKTREEAQWIEIKLKDEIAILKTVNDKTEIEKSSSSSDAPN